MFFYIIVIDKVVNFNSLLNNSLEEHSNMSITNPRFKPLEEY